MRRALLVILIATALVVSGWSATVAATSVAPVAGVVATASDDAAPVVDRLSGLAVPATAASAPLVSAVPAVRLLVGRGGAMATLWLLLLTLLVAFDRRLRSWIGRGTGEAPPSGAPVLSVAPRRGPPVGHPRPLGT